VKRHAEQAALAAVNHARPDVGENPDVGVGHIGHVRKYADDTLLFDDEPATRIARRLQHRNRLQHRYLFKDALGGHGDRGRRRERRWWCRRGRSNRATTAAAGSKENYHADADRRTDSVNWISHALPLFTHANTGIVPAGAARVYWRER
jgi:hypothetical protein